MLQVLFLFLLLFLPAGWVDLYAGDDPPLQGSPESSSEPVTLPLPSGSSGAPPFAPSPSPSDYLIEVTIVAPYDLLGAQEKISPLDRIPQERLLRSPSLGKALEGSPAALARSYSGLGSLESLQLRGLPASAVLFLLDGVPLRFPLSGAPDLSLLPTPVIEEARILRGGGSHLFGGNAMGGVVELDTTPRREGTRGFLRAGGYGEVEGDLLFARPSSLWGALGIQRARGDYPYPAGERIGSRCTLLCLFRTDRYRQEVTLKERKNNGFLGGRGLFGWSQGIGSWFTNEVRLYAAQSRKEVPGSLSTPTPLGYQESLLMRFLNRMHIGARENPFALAFAWDEERIEYGDDLFVPLASPSLSRARSLSLFALRRQELFSHLHLFLYGDRRYETGVLPGGSTPSRHLYGAGALLQYAQETWGIQSSTRMDGAIGRNPVFLPAGGIFYSGIPGVILKGEYHEGYRDPTFNDLYWPNQAGARGNPELEPERSRGGGGAVEVHTSLFAINLAVYTEVARKLILWQPVQGIWTPQNVGKAWARGIEVALFRERPLLKERRGMHLTFSAHYSYRLSENRDETLRQNVEILRKRGRKTFPREGGYPQLPLVPLHQGGGEAGLEYRELKSVVGIRYLGKRAAGADNTTYLPEMSILYAFIEYHFDTTISGTARIRGENLLNQYNEEIPGYPAPPRQIFFEMEVAL